MEQIVSNQQPRPEFGPKPVPEQVTDFIETQAREKKGSAGCITAVIVAIAFGIVFIFFGNKIFSFFNLQNIYHFIISCVIIIIVYIVALVAIGLSITYPKDLITIAEDRKRF